jgi:hypothetical protein
MREYERRTQIQPRSRAHAQALIVWGDGGGWCSWKRRGWNPLLAPGASKGAEVGEWKRTRSNLASFCVGLVGSHMRGAVVVRHVRASEGVCLPRHCEALNMFVSLCAGIIDCRAYDVIFVRRSRVPREMHHAKGSS